MSSKIDYTINFGPQHPAAHGVLRLILHMKGETIQYIEPHIGLLHRGTEKLVEQRPYNQNIGYMDRLDYVSMMCNEHAYILAIEKLLGIQPPIRAQYIRVMFDEITRILNHLLCIGACALDIGAMSVLLYTFIERETLMDCYEAVSGARMHATYYRPGGVYRDLPQQMPLFQASTFTNSQELERMNANRKGSLLDFLQSFVHSFPQAINRYESLLTHNHIWQQRTIGIGRISAQQAIELGCTGPILRATGVAWDLRKNQPYEVYSKINFEIPTKKNGDCYDRYLIRIQEMRESNKIIQQCINWLRENPGPVMIDDYRITPPDRTHMKNDMESLIRHFKLSTEGYTLPEGKVYASIEHPKGEFGVFLISDGANKPYRLKIRGASFVHLSALNALAKNSMLSDLVAILSSIDIVLGEVDR